MSLTNKLRIEGPTGLFGLGAYSDVGAFSDLGACEKHFSQTGH